MISEESAQNHEAIGRDADRPAAASTASMNNSSWLGFRRFFIGSLLCLTGLARAANDPSQNLGTASGAPDTAAASAAQTVSPNSVPPPVSIPSVAASPSPLSLTPIDVDDVALLKTPFRLNHPARNVAFFANVELGALSFVKHSFQSGKDGSVFDLKTEGNQSTMFLFARLSAELEFVKRHSFIFVYQPLEHRSLPPPAFSIDRDLRL